MESTALTGHQEAGQALATMSDRLHVQPPVINYITSEYSGTNASDTHTDKPDSCICGNWEVDTELLYICLGPFPSVLPELDLDTPEYQYMLLPPSSSQYSLEEVLQCDALLADHPLLPRLQELVEGNHDSPLVHSLDLSNGLCNGTQEADHLLLTAVNILEKSTVCASNNYNIIEQVDSDCKSSAREISSFCQALLESLSPQGKENKQQPSNFESTSKHTRACTANISKQSCKLLQKEADLAKSNIQFTKKRSSLSDKAATVLRRWLSEHAHHPYPNNDEKEELCLRTGLAPAQLSNWFSNARRRVLTPHLK